MRVSLLFILILFRFMLSAQHSASIHSGELDLRDWKFSNKPLLGLSGNWMFYPGKTRADLSSDTCKGMEIKVPDSWAGSMGKTEGYGCYRLMIYKNTDQGLAIQFIGFSSASNLYLNGEKVYSAGKFATEAKDYSPDYRPQVIDLPFGEDSVELIIEIANFNLFHGGITSNITLGTNNQIRLEEQRKLIRFFFMLGAILIVGLYHITVYFFDSSNKNGLIFGLFCLVINLRSFIFDGYSFQYFNEIPWTLQIRIEYLTTYLSLPLFFQFFYSNFKQEFNRNMQRAVWVIGILLCAVTLVASTNVFSFLLDGFQLAALVFGASIIFSLVKALKHKRSGALFTLVGFVLFFIAFVNDILYADNLIDTFPLITYGIFAFIMVQSAFLARQYVQAFKKIKSLSFNLLRTNRALQRFVPEDFLKILNKKSITEVALNNWTEMEMTIMFSDIRAFTELSEKLSPNEAFTFINEYLKRMGPIIRKHHGFIDKYIGDGIMALFPGNRENAILAGKEMLEALKLLNAEHKLADKPSIEIGIGIHTGQCILGTIGEHERMETTVISDSVNLAARIEGLTKHYKCNFIVSAETLATTVGAEGTIRKRFIGVAKVKGKSISTDLYEVISSDFIDDAYIEQFEKAIRHYFNKEFTHCFDLMNELKSDSYFDGVLHFYIGKCQQYITDKLPESWSAIEVFEY